MNVTASRSPSALPNSAKGKCHLEERHVARRVVYVSALALPLCGCSGTGAPSFDIFGAFFPAWLLCALLGIFAALGARLFFVARNLTDVLPFQLSVCTALGTIFALLVWLICFGR
jgi:hypothetical protein